MARVPEKRSSKLASVLATNQAYGDGCDRGHLAAGRWLADPKRGNPNVAGTLQHILVDMAERYAAAVLSNSETARSAIRGEIVGFSYYLECPGDAEELRRARRRACASEREPVKSP